MYARDILTRPVVVAHPGTPVREAISLLTEHGFAALPVVDDDGRVTGVFSESDALKVASHLDTAIVGAVMTKPVEVIHPGTDTATIAARMLGSGLRSLPVVEAGLLVGIVARRDVLRALIHDDAIIEARIRALLDDYAGSRRQWSLEVAEGAVTVRGAFADDTEQKVVAALARTVEGVRRVELAGEAVALPER
ncbi:CBS domain-containing protein [Nocardia sp. NPDC127526]|uniref:CBS domain-containing protein n=1 Tax=Nocardia sp. NPDC127526 TaxID=3345393 RepID=UPI0036404BBC